MGNWANKADSQQHTHTHKLVCRWLNTAGLQASALFSLLTHTFGSVHVCANVCDTVLSSARQPPPHHQTPPQAGACLYPTVMLSVSASLSTTQRHNGRETKACRLTHGTRIYDLMEQIGEDNVWSIVCFLCLSVCAFEYLSSSLAPGGDVEKWEGAGGAGDCGLRGPRGHTLRGGAGPGKAQA